MGSRMPKKRLEDLVAALSDQGARVRKSRSGGYVVIGDNNRLVPLHTTPSDQNVERNMRRKIERAGLTWPL